MVPGIVYLSRPSDTDTDQPAAFGAMAYGLDSSFGFRVFRPGLNSTGGAFTISQVHQWDITAGVSHKQVIQGDAQTQSSDMAGVSMSATPDGSWGWFCSYGWTPCAGVFAVDNTVKTAAAGAVTNSTSGAGDSRLIVGRTVVANTSIFVQGIL